LEKEFLFGTLYHLKGRTPDLLAPTFPEKGRKEGVEGGLA